MLTPPHSLEQNARAVEVIGGVQSSSSGAMWLRRSPTSAAWWARSGLWCAVFERTTNVHDFVLIYGECGCQKCLRPEVQREILAQMKRPAIREIIGYENYKTFHWE
jgi:hypothetical protein